MHGAPRPPPVHQQAQQCGEPLVDAAARVQRVVLELAAEEIAADARGPITAVPQRQAGVEFTQPARLRREALIDVGLQPVRRPGDDLGMDLGKIPFPGAAPQAEIGREIGDQKVA